jgi:hypothetical protein
MCAVRKGTVQQPRILLQQTKFASGTEMPQWSDMRLIVFAMLFWENKPDGPRLRSSLSSRMGETNRDMQSCHWRSRREMVLCPALQTLTQTVLKVRFGSVLRDTDH